MSLTHTQKHMRAYVPTHDISVQMIMRLLTNRGNRRDYLLNYTTCAKMPNNQSSCLSKLHFPQILFDTINL